MAVGKYKARNILKATAEKNSTSGGSGLSRSRMSDQSMSTLLTVYDIQLEEMREQLRLYQKQMSEMKQNFVQVTKENERLNAELKEALEKKLDALPFMTLKTDIPADDYIVKNLQQQLQLMTREKEQAVELWQSVLQEYNRLKQLYQERMTETHFHVAEGQKQEDHLTDFEQLTQQMHVATEKAAKSNQKFMKIISDQSMELEQLQKQLRQSKIDEEAANAKVDEMTRLTEKLQSEIEMKEEEVLAAQQRERAADKRLQQMQISIKQLEIRLCVTLQEAEQLRTEGTALEKQMGELKKKCTYLEREKYNAVAKVQECIQHLEEASLQKNQALFGEKQKEEELNKMKNEMSQLKKDIAERIRKAIDSTKKQYNVQISQLREELLALQMECGEKQSQIERGIREKKAVEAGLERIYKEDRRQESKNRKLEQLSQKFLLAETEKGDLQLSLQATQNKLKQLEMNSEEEKSRCQEVISKLQSTLDSEREKSVIISEQRLKLQQENEQLQKEMDSLRKLAADAQKKAKIKISTMEHEHAVKKHGFEAQLKEMEDSCQKSAAGLRRLLLAQQKTINRWKDEAKYIAETTEARISKLKSELSEQKLQSQKLISQLEMANEKVTEDEKLMMGYREHIKRLQSRLNQSEERAAAASQQLRLITTKKKTAVSLMDLENI